MLTTILEGDPEIEVVGRAKDGREAVQLTEALKPDVITMDIHMPVMNGLEATERIMAFHPTPILVVTSLPLQDEMNLAFRCIAVGALEVMEKPSFEHLATLPRATIDLIVKVKMISKIPVIPHPAGKLKYGSEGIELTEPREAEGRLKEVKVGPWELPPVDREPSGRFSLGFRPIFQPEFS